MSDISGQSTENLGVQRGDRANTVSASIRSAIRWWRSDATQRAIRQVLIDLVESCERVARKTRVPTRKGILGFFGNQVLINTAAWTAAVMAASLVETFFEVKGFRNLWGLTASRSRSLVSADEYELIMTVTSYTAGLVILILMRHLILRLISEFHSLRSERAARGMAKAVDRSYE